MIRNVLSLFNGIRVGLDRANIKIDKFYSSEIDKYANAITDYQYPDTIQLGDITQWESWDINNIDLIVFGSPCQGFSFAGKQLNFNDPRSALFFKAVDIVNHYKQKYFLMENVKMKKDYQDVISDLLGVQPILINSALLSAQNRQRLYWTNIPTVKQPEDKGLLLKDIVETGCVDRDKSYCIDANYHKGGNLKSYFEKHRRQLIFELKQINGRVEGVSISEDGIRPHKGDARKSGISEMGRISFEDAEKTYCLTANHAPKILGSTRVDTIKSGGQGDRIYSTEGKAITLSAQSGGTAGAGNMLITEDDLRPCEPREFKEDSLCHHAATAMDIKGNESIKRVYAETGKAPTLTTMGGGHREPKILCGAMRGRYLVDETRKDGKMLTAGKTKQYIELRHDEKTNCLTAVQKDNNIVITDSKKVRHLPEQLTYRKLTVVECERLQTFDDNFTLNGIMSGKEVVISNTQRYKALGNSFTCDVIAHILKGINNG